MAQMCSETQQSNTDQLSQGTVHRNKTPYDDRAQGCQHMGRETLRLPQTRGISQQFPREAGPGFPVSLHVNTEFQSPSLVPLCHGSSCVVYLIVLVIPYLCCDLYIPVRSRLAQCLGDRLCVCTSHCGGRANSVLQQAEFI